MTRLRYILDLLSVMPELRLTGTACYELDFLVDVSYSRCTKREFDVSGLSVALQVKWLEKDVQKAIFGALLSVDKFPWTPDGFSRLASEIEHRLPSRPWFLDADVGVPYFRRRMVDEPIEVRIRTPSLQNITRIFNI